MSELLQSDFDGNSGGRIDKVIYTSPNNNQCRGEKDCSLPAREVFFLDSDPLLIVNAWNIEEIISVDKSHMRIKVNFKVLAKTEGTGTPWWENMSGREIRAIKGQQEQRINYDLALKDGKWKLIDPPMPCVGILAIVKFFKSKEESYRERFSKLKSNGDSFQLMNIMIHHEWALRQLQVLNLVNL
ncbi:MAG: hypothetical protein HY272_02560 [Gammaproteobacteria bacterium]|nr:hypothetical protein [Gammaproteobacteria bacterium]